MTDHEIRSKIFLLVLDRFSRDESRRKESLLEYFSVTMPDLDRKTAEAVALAIPEIMPTLYGKWIDMFIERLHETVPRNQIELLCSGGEDNDAALLLTYIMFLESERMEKQMAEDLAEYGMRHSLGDEAGAAAAEFLRLRLTRSGKKEAAGPRQ
ncbi:MAG: hypothetical protein EOM25_01290 [Deltaproteobacteria bacterium]|nr:hypothetical protein [Deltaproteobacteria bacterium]